MKNHLKHPKPYKWLKIHIILFRDDFSFKRKIYTCLCVRWTNAAKIDLFEDEVKKIGIFQCIIRRNHRLPNINTIVEMEKKIRYKSWHCCQWKTAFMDMFTCHILYWYGCIILMKCFWRDCLFSMLFSIQFFNCTRCTTHII